MSHDVVVGPCFVYTLCAMVLPSIWLAFANQVWFAIVHWWVLHGWSSFVCGMLLSTSQPAGNVSSPLS